MEKIFLCVLVWLWSPWYCSKNTHLGGLKQQPTSHTLKILNAMLLRFERLLIQTVPKSRACHFAQVITPFCLEIKFPAHMCQIIHLPFNIKSSLFLVCPLLHMQFSNQMTHVAFLLGHYLCCANAIYQLRAMIVFHPQ